jgi:ketosteroid isomerase-like protein
MTDTAPSRDDIIKLERSYWDAMQRKDGSKTSELSADPALATGMNGVMRIAKSKMGQMTEEGKWTLESYEFDNIEVSSPTPDIAIIAYTVNQKITLDGKPKSFRAADSSTWVRGARGWECHAHSETILDSKH